MLVVCESIILNFQLSILNCAKAQDIHFSMLDLDPMLFNPAYSGFFDGSGRFGAVYRNQWASVSVPYQTVTATAEVALMRSGRTGSGLSAGFWASADCAGTLDYGSTQASLVANWFQAVDGGDNLVSVAVEGGVGQVGFSTDNMDLSDPEESFPVTGRTYWTLGGGAAWFSQWSDIFYTKVGFAARNINQPEIAFLETSGDRRLALRWSLYGRAEWRAWRRISLLPVVGFQRQGPYSELVYGCDARWYVEERPQEYLALGWGLTGRHGDAVTLDVAVMWREWTFAVSYDANVSRLAEASHTFGALEFGVVYMIRKKDRRKMAIPCPII